VSTLLSFLVSPVALLTIILCLVGSVVLLRGANISITSQSEQLQQDLKALRRAQRVGSLMGSGIYRTDSTGSRMGFFFLKKHILHLSAPYPWQIWK
jgi:hypothetical protein